MPRDQTKVYIGNLPSDVLEKEVDDLFHKFGRIKYIDVKKTGNGSAFAFVEFEDERDADDAVHSRDGYDFDGRRLRVEFPRGVGPRGPGGRPLSEGRSRQGDNRLGRHRGGPQRRSDFRVQVTGLPPTGSWQDLKDHLREAGDICFANVARNGDGIVEFMRYEDVKCAIRKYDDTKFKSHEGETSYIRIRDYSSSAVKRTESRDRSRSRSRTRSRSPRSRRNSSSNESRQNRSPTRSPSPR